MESELREMGNGKTVLPIQEGWNGEKISQDESDLPPEYCHYRDEGCDLAESCLNCPFACCIYDEPGGKQRWIKKLRAREIARLFIIEGKKAKELSQMFGISQRTVQRALKSCQKEGLGNATRRGQKVSESSNPANAKGSLERLDQERNSKK